MNFAPVTFKEVYARLEKLGSEAARRIFAKLGAGENQFGVKLGDLRPLAKKLGTNHPLALELWATGNADAMILATMIMDPAALTIAEIERLVKPVTYFRLIDELVFNVLVHSPHAETLRTRWVKSSKALIGRAGWKLLSERITSGDTAGLDLDAILKTIEAEMLKAPRRKQEAMNACLVMIGVHCPDRRKQCIALGEKLGRFDPTPVPKGCVSSYAPEWIAAVLKRRK